MEKKVVILTISFAGLSEKNISYLTIWIILVNFLLILSHFNVFENVWLELHT